LAELAARDDRSKRKVERPAGKRRQKIQILDENSEIYLRDKMVIGEQSEKDLE
jgi:hypothetical protein